MKFLSKAKIWFLALPKRKKIILVVGAVVLAFALFQIFGNKKNQVQYQTAQVEKGTLVASVAASGQVTTANNVSITIQASGVVKEVYVKNGDHVILGQKIADLTLDQASQQKQAAALSSFLSAQNSLNSAQSKMNSLQSALFKANQSFMNDRGIINPITDDPKYIEEKADWLAAEADYKNQTNVIAQAQAGLNSASLSLSQTSSTITAPVAGVVKGLTITPGAIIALSGSTNSTAGTSQVLGSIYQTGPIQAQVSISEIDSVHVNEGQKASLILDAFPALTFTGKVVSINTNGVVTSGVSAYPAVISFDNGNDHIYPNMSVTANIITKTKDNVLLVPNAAVQTQNGQSTVRILTKGQAEQVQVEIGDSSDTQTEITSGLNQGEEVITGTVAPAQRAAGSISPFGLRGGFGQGGQRVGGGR